MEVKFLAFSQKWKEIIDEVSTFQNCKQYTWFRGQPDSNYVLKSGLYRYEAGNDNLHWATEKTYYEFFKRLGHTLHKESDFNLLYIMQHHGVRTRLLDWTESFSVALFFAYDTWKKHDEKKRPESFSVYMLDPLKLNEKSTGKKSFYTFEEEYESIIRTKNMSGMPENSVALFPLKNNSRIIAQLGTFTLQGLSQKPLEEEFSGELLEKGILKQIKFNKALSLDIEKYLKQTGHNHFSLFPDLDGLSKYINNMGVFITTDEIEN